MRAAAYGAVLRQGSQSLTVASITCFIAALMQGEVTAQTSAAQRAREEANTELQRHLKALGSASARCHPYCWRSKQESVYSGDHHAASCDCGLLGTSLLVAIQIERPPSNSTFEQMTSRLEVRLVHDYELLEGPRTRDLSGT